MTILLYSPTMEGHPQVYCRVLARILVREGHDVVIAGTGNTEDWPLQFNELLPLMNHPHVQFVNTVSQSASGQSELRAEELRALQDQFKIDSTLFAFGDYFAHEFRRISFGDAPRLLGRNVAIFSHTSRWFPGEDQYSGEKIPRLGSTVRQNVGRLKRAVFNRKETDQYFYETVLIRQKVVDSIIIKDERILDKFEDSVVCMPEIYRVFDDDPRGGSDLDEFSEPIQRFIDQAGVKNVVLYFGTGTWYKGYDYFLKLADLDPSIYALHTGAPERKEPKVMAFDTEALRNRLRSQGRLYETNAYVEGVDQVNFLFNSIERFVSTHRLTLSSGTMLQALEAGKPVLVPNTGLVGWRVEKFGLGKTYTYLDEKDLSDQWSTFREEPVAEYKERIETYMESFSEEAVRSFFIKQLCD